ncbi:hypothetical protein [Dyadobacter sp. Leaf189]|uniref:hypothetical protein n=1 Tax=Dyadobacter sp. Leaf189 TaxID=1736295 RepID=UPI0006F9EDCF|nr:hypothetical protein [Dyadobacter sp. Leaf189]KQS26769.1 hypothetical protein ASG33_19640 [Dyadobacter sp. Leaf189]
MKYIPVLLLLLIVSSCDWIGNSPSFGDDFITYTIRKGNHEVDNNLNTPFTSSSMHFQAIFDSSCVYQNAVPENQNDINKLYGFSDCSSGHQNNSARFGWNWREGALRIYAYVYVNGVRQEKELGTAELNELTSFRLAAGDKSYIFTFRGVETTMPRHCDGGVGIAYKLLPYFGGDEAAPQDISIKIRNL